mmetsp:Transcript_46588/g.77012  ORF Transcript_46588/g.77012 Transcript_46588/m.77012 type:complete len:82 (-) Transcript_46588:321-566(-)
MGSCCELGTDTKISELHMAFTREKQICGLDISMDNEALGVQMLQPQQKLSAHCGNLWFGQRSVPLLQDGMQGADAKFHGYP